MAAPAAASNAACELLTQLQDQLETLSRLFYYSIGVLQQNAPPQSTTGEEVIAQPPFPGFDVQHEVQTMAKQIMDEVQRTDQLLQMLPDNMVSKKGNPDQAAAADGQSSSSNAQDEFTQEVKALQLEHQQVSQELAQAVEDVEGMLLQLQQLYAALAQAKLQARRQ